MRWEKTFRECHCGLLPPGKDMLAAGGSTELSGRRIRPDCGHGVDEEQVIGLPGLTKDQAWHLARLPCRSERFH